MGLHVSNGSRRHTATPNKGTGRHRAHELQMPDNQLCLTFFMSRGWLPTAPKDAAWSAPSFAFRAGPDTFKSLGLPPTVHKKDNIARLLACGWQITDLHLMRGSRSADVEVAAYLQRQNALTLRQNALTPEARTSAAQFLEELMGSSVWWFEAMRAVRQFTRNDRGTTLVITHRPARHNARIGRTSNPCVAAVTDPSTITFTGGYNFFW